MIPTLAHCVGPLPLSKDTRGPSPPWGGPAAANVVFSKAPLR